MLCSLDAFADTARARHCHLPRLEMRPREVVVRPHWLSTKSVISVDDIPTSWSVRRYRANGPAMASSYAALLLHDFTDQSRTTGTICPSVLPFIQLYAMSISYGLSFDARRGQSKFKLTAGGSSRNRLMGTVPC